ncbi:hypothetical protein [Clostridium thermopalmarium]|uniref:Uncharacterized protein n=1 Tax=Clostridium thermopalmarium DSM 5974 TaxID=1121340 RepID=A0A2T0AQM5_9CLOT|nr:hypothetical protein [Clostridium thermopalmarium]MBE6043494.1 hypothetical protein [Clostridium thermopalmarium]PRR71633.1 hypothetical protein CPAL_16670 [Clostridium thermopalmarium DSM 5974]PVZ15793.1 hypothetical protein LX19_02820 [Clostridium thermopalmarium DSM 5974]
MICDSTKMIIAQNCIGYEPKYIISLLSMTSLSESCNNCQNYIRGNCIKGLFDDMVETIKRN